MKLKIELQVIEPEEDNFHLLAVSNFDDGSTGGWIIDTGASRSVFDKNLQDQYQPARSGENQLHTAGIGDKPIATVVACIRPFMLGKLKVENLEAALLDLSHINQLYQRTCPVHVCGLLGGDFFIRYNAVVSYKKKILVLEM